MERVRVLLPEKIDAVLPEGQVTVLRGRSMGCDWIVTCVPPLGTDVRALERAVVHALQNVIDQMSNWEADSLITRFNRAAPGSWLNMPPEFAQVLGCALLVARASDGAMDPTAGELARLWGFGAQGRHHHDGFALPAAQDIAAARERSGWRKLPVDADAFRVQQRGGVELDFSAVAKGFGVDEVCRVLRETHVTHHLVEIGGELRGAGLKPEGQPWWVDVEQPADCASVIRTRVALHGQAIATSGDYLQGYTAEGHRYSHCIDPRTGRPIDNGVRSVTVLHGSCMEADAWATALMVLGVDAGLALAEAERLAARWIVQTDDDVTEHCSSAWTALIADAS